MEVVGGTSLSYNINHVVIQRGFYIFSLESTRELDLQTILLHPLSNRKCLS